jgi:multiple sugar transport system substrate-binding protein
VFGKGGTHLLFLNGLGGADGETMKQMLGNYVKENPNVSIDFQTLGWDDVFKKLDTTLVAGTPPELVVMHATEIPQYGSRNALQPVDTWYAQKLLPKEDWSPAVLDKATYDGKIQAVPLDIHDYNCYISVDLLKQNGIDPEKQPVGQDFIDAAQKVSHQTPNSLGTATFGTSGFGSFGTMALLWQFGGDVLSPDGKEVTINSQQAQDAMQMYNDLAYKYKVYPQPGVKYGDLTPLGRVAWRTDGSWAYNYYKDHHLAPPQVMAGQFPQIGAKPVVWMNSHELTIPVGISGTRFDEAQKLILWISNHNVDWAQSGQPPARLSAQNSPLLKEDWAWSVRKFADVTTKYGRYEVSPPQYTQVRDLQYKAFDDVLANKKPVKTILDDYATQIKGVLTY